MSVLIVTSFSLVFEFLYSKIEYSAKEIAKIETNIIENKKQQVDEENETKEVNIEKSAEEKIEKFDWYIEIPKIDLYAQIEEGTEEEILNRSVGHFEDTSRRNGNCGFAAHNRGYPVNFFSRLKELEIGDIVNYFVDGKKYQYKIEEILIIYETDWSMLEETGENKITLITCVENREEYRLCVQGSLVEE